MLSNAVVDDREHVSGVDSETDAPMLTLILTSLLAVGPAYGADTAPDDQNIQSLESQVATSSELSDSLRGSLTEELSQARQRLGDLQTQAIELEVVQGEATTSNADVQRLQQQIQALTKPPSSEPPTLQDDCRRRPHSVNSPCSSCDVPYWRLVSTRYG